MAELNTHWTERSVDDYLYKVGWDFVRQIESLLGTGNATQAMLARRLGVTEGRVSQVLNNPGNLTLRQIIKYARALGKKVAVVAYDDGDASNERGPVPAEVFTQCWVRAGRPSDFHSLRPAVVASCNTDMVLYSGDQKHAWLIEAKQATTSPCAGFYRMPWDRYAADTSPLAAVQYQQQQILERS